MQNNRDGLIDAEQWWRERPDHRLLHGALSAADVESLSDLARVSLFNVRREMDPNRQEKSRRRWATMQRQFARERAAEMAPGFESKFGEAPRPLPKFRKKLKRP